MRISGLAGVVCYAGWLAVSTHAQTGGAPVQGTITDPTGAVVPGASVVLTQSETAVVQKTTTNSAGIYVFPASPLGDYRLTVSSPGMETWEGSVLLQAGLAATVDVKLKIGATATQITVGDVTPMVDVTTPTVSERLDRARIEQFPVNDVMGLVQTTTPGFEGGGSAPRAYGLRNDSAELTVDGAPASDRSEGGTQSAAPESTYVQEVQVNTINSSARYNRPATVVVVTKSGSNKVHGQAYESNQDNSVAGVARQRQNTFTQAPFLIQNLLGAAVGGPVYIPKLYDGRKRTFFFFDFSRYYLRQRTSISTSVPTAAERNGDFSALTDGALRPVTLYDPYSTGAAPTYARMPFPGNRIPSSRQAPLAKYLYSITPLPTLADVNPAAGSNWIGGAKTFQDRNAEMLRIDHTFSEKDRFFARTQRASRLTASNSGTGAPLLGDTTNLTYNMYPDRNGVLSWTHTFSPTLFSEFLFSDSWQYFQFYTGRDANNDVDAVLGLPNPFDGKGWPAISNTGYGTTYSASTPRKNITNIYNAQEDLTKTHGRHQIQFGAGIRFEHDNVLPQQQQVPGSDSFGSNYTALYNPSSGLNSPQPFGQTGSPKAGMYMGLLETYNNTFARSYYLWRYAEYSAYAQDEFKVTPRLTLTYGLRYEYRPPFHEARNNITGFDKARDAVVLPLSRDEMIRRGYTVGAIYDQFVAIGMKVETPDEAGLPSSLVNPNRRDFSPRAGVAYRLGPGAKAFVVRGGYGMYYFATPSFGFEANMRSNPPESNLFTYSFNSSIYQPLPSYALLSAPSVVAGVNSMNVIDISRPNAIAPGSMNPLVYFNPHLPTSRAHQWNLTVEKEWLANTVVSASYIGTAGRSLDQSYGFNQAPNDYVWYTTTGLPKPTGLYSAVATRQYDQTTWQNITQFSHIGYSNYSGLKLEVLHRYSKGYAFQWFYVMGNAITTVTANSNTAGSQNLVPLDTNLYLPGTVPADLGALERFLYYQRDTSFPKHRMGWNFMVDLPFGKGKPIGRNAGRLLDAAIGGWQLSGNGAMNSNWNTLPAGNWANFAPFQTYGKNTPVVNCTSGVCVDGYLWYNAYIPANLINRVNASGVCTGVCGIPSGFKPISTPLYPIPADGGSKTDPVYSYYDSNTVFITLKNGSVVQTALNTGLNPYRNQYFLGPFSYSQNAVMFKNFFFSESARARLEADVFNVFNAQGLNQPGTYGISSKQTSAKSARAIQLGVRLFW